MAQTLLAAGQGVAVLNTMASAAIAGDQQANASLSNIVNSGAIDSVPVTAIMVNTTEISANGGRQGRIDFDWSGYQVGSSDGKAKLPVGHAGVAAVNGDGAVKYFEFGLYGPGNGNVRTWDYGAGTIAFDSNGDMTTDSVTALTQELSTAHEQGSNALVFVNRGDTAGVINYANWQAQNVASHPYSIWDINMCYTFAANAFFSRTSNGANVNAFRPFYVRVNN